MSSVQKRLTVCYSGGAYPLFIGQGLIKKKDWLCTLIKSAQVMVVSNAHIAHWYLDTVLAAFENKQCDHFLFPDGEQYKQLKQVEALWNCLAESQYHRDATLVALGGGVVGDMVGFAAACYHRGIDFIQIPTTLLAQTDAAIGGKTGVNHPCGKNLIGAFYQPKAVLIDIETLSTLPDREYRSGLFELIKHALIKDGHFFSWIEGHIDALIQRRPNILMKALERSCEIKANVVFSDEKERRGERALLNLGHTFGHAIEQNLNYTGCLHGEAVAIGILIAARWSVIEGYLSEKDYQRIHAVFSVVGMTDDFIEKISVEAMLAALWNDKKIVKNRLHFIILRAIGCADLICCTDQKKLRELLLRYFHR